MSQTRPTSVFKHFWEFRRTNDPFYKLVKVNILSSCLNQLLDLAKVFPFSCGVYAAYLLSSSIEVVLLIHITYLT